MMYTNWMQPQQVGQQPNQFGRVGAAQGFQGVPYGNLSQQEFGPAPQMNPNMGQPGAMGGGFARPQQPMPRPPQLQSMPGPNQMPQEPGPAVTNWMPMNRGGDIASQPLNGTATSQPFSGDTMSNGLPGQQGAGVYSPIGQQPNSPPQQYSPMAPAPRPPAQYSPIARAPNAGFSPAARGGLFGMRR